MSKGQSLQDPFLNALRKERVPVSIFLVNGIKLQGQIESFDQFVVLLKNSVSQMVYKHAISTVVPASRPSSQIPPRKLAIFDPSLSSRACADVSRKSHRAPVPHRPAALDRCRRRHLPYR